MRERERASSSCQDVGCGGERLRISSNYVMKDSRIGDSNKCFWWFHFWIWGHKLAINSSYNRYRALGKVQHREKRLKSQSCDLRMHSSYKHVVNPQALNRKQNKLYTGYTMQIHAVDSQWSGIDRSWYFTQLANYQAKRARDYEGKSENHWKLSSHATSLPEYP